MIQCTFFQQKVWNIFKCLLPSLKFYKHNVNVYMIKSLYKFWELYNLRLWNFFRPAHFYISYKSQRLDKHYQISTIFLLYVKAGWRDKSACTQSVEYGLLLIFVRISAESKVINFCYSAFPILSEIFLLQRQNVIKSVSQRNVTSINMLFCVFFSDKPVQYCFDSQLSNLSRT